MDFRGTVPFFGQALNGRSDPGERDCVSAPRFEELFTFRARTISSETTRERETQTKNRKRALETFMAIKEDDPRRFLHPDTIARIGQYGVMPDEPSDAEASTEPPLAEPNQQDAE